VTEPPTGAVTFLFTDIEGSTRLVKQLRERYAEVLADHRRLLRAAFGAHGGYEVDTQGDSFFVAFTSARDALLAAVEGQLALSSHPWPEGVRIKVRMGLHTGQAVASEGRYTGLAVHRAARIGAAGHGGQILVSQATQTLLEDEEEELHRLITSGATCPARACGAQVESSGVLDPSSTTTQPSNSSNRHGAFIGTTVAPSVSTRKLPQSAAGCPPLVSQS
jgi:class 3 adenylate cyclase